MKKGSGGVPRTRSAPAFYTSPVEHAAALHPSSARPKLRVSIARKDSSSPGGWREQAVDVEDLPEVLPAVAGERDVYISTQRFHGFRRISQLAELGALFSDVDYHRVPELASMHPLAVLEQAVAVLEREKIPAPSLAISSGRGLYLVWLHSPIPRSALPRWNACQRRIFEALRPLGADAAARDAARVLRLIGTRHGSADVIVEALSPASSADDVWSFDDLATEVLPFTRAEIRDMRVQKALRRSQDRLWTPPEGLTRATLWEARLSDLQQLRKIRWFGEPMPDFRDRWLFIAGVGMGYIAIPAVMQRELYALAKEVGGWTEARARSKLQSVFRTVREAFERSPDASSPDPRYRLRNQTIIELLEITGDEEREMRTVISDGERRRRDRERKSRERRESGEISRSRDEYLSTAAERRHAAVELRSGGMSLRKIGARLGVSHEAVRKMLAASAIDAAGEGVNSPSRCMVAEPSPEGTRGAVGETGEGERTAVIRDVVEVFELARRFFGLVADDLDRVAPELAEQLALEGFDVEAELGEALDVAVGGG